MERALSAVTSIASKALPCVFLDRDGVINKKTGIPATYVRNVQEFELLPNVVHAIKRLNDSGYLVVVATNQRGVARGLMTMADVESIHKYMKEELCKCGARIDAIYVCPHEDGTCECRKPKPGLFKKAFEDFDIDKSRSFMIGDSKSDMEAADACGIKGILVDDGEADASNWVKAHDLTSAVEMILGEAI